MYEWSFCMCQVWRKIIINDGGYNKPKDNVLFLLYPVSLFHSFHLSHPLFYFSVAFSLLLFHRPVPHSLWMCPKCHIYCVSVSASALYQSHSSSISSHTPWWLCKERGDSLSTNRFLWPPLWGLTTTSVLNVQPIMCSLLTHTLIHLEWAMSRTPPREGSSNCSAHRDGTKLRDCMEALSDRGEPSHWNMMLSELHETQWGQTEEQPRPQFSVFNRN